MTLDERALRGRIKSGEFATEAASLRTELLDLQRELLDADFPLVLVLDGDDRIGLNEVLHRLHEWFDPRSLEVGVYESPGEMARERPYFWRYWRDLPARGKIGIYAGAWVTQVARERLVGAIKSKETARRLAAARDFEALLVADGALVLKIWLHLEKKESKKKIADTKNEAERHWRLEDEDRDILAHYRRAMKIAEEIIEGTNAPESWTVIDGGDEDFRDLGVGRLIRDRLRARLATETKSVRSAELETAPAAGRLAALPRAPELSNEDYESRKDAAQEKIAGLVRRLRAAGRSLVLVFEGQDAAGKGGAIRRITAALDARDFRVHAISAPTEEERAHHYLWRFWRRLPGAGKVAIFDRSWYGRLLVERVEGFADESEWRRAFHEISSFEHQLADHGTVLLKFWLAIDADEQLRRFEAREETPWKRHKITPEDYRNRDRWDDYVVAAEDVFAATDLPESPWHLIDANDKRHARVAVLEAVVERLKTHLDRASGRR